LVLTADGNGSGDGEGERAAESDGSVEDGVDAAEEGSTECGEAVGEQLGHGVAFIDTADVDLWAGFGLSFGHGNDSSMLLELAAQVRDLLFQFGYFLFEDFDTYTKA
jgi:hypothetical protein